MREEVSARRVSVDVTEEDPTSLASRTAFIRKHTALEPVPMVPEIRLYTATELVPLWRATESWLAERGLAVPFWCVPWAGGQALARWVLDNPEVVRGKRVLDFGTGSGLLAIAAAKAGAAEVRAVDVDPVAAAACALNAAANGVTIDIRCEDIVDREVVADVVLAGDVWYELGPSARFAKWLRALARGGTRVITGDPGRAYVPTSTRELATYDVPTSLELESSLRRVGRVLEFLPVGRHADARTTTKRA
jgi:predicted nicotinamide N-methyase